MRAVAVIAAALLLSSCTWLKQEAPWIAPAPPQQPSTPATPPPKPVQTKPARPRTHIERPTPQPAAVQSAAPAAPVEAAPPPVDYDMQCKTMAANRAQDARGLGASPADQAKIQSDTYRDCMAQSVK